MKYLPMKGAGGAIALLMEGGGGGVSDFCGGEGEGIERTSSSGSGGCISAGSCGPMMIGATGLMICRFSRANLDKKAATFFFLSCCTCFSLLADAIFSRATAMSFALSLSSASFLAACRRSSSSLLTSGASGGGHGGRGTSDTLCRAVAM